MNNRALLLLIAAGLTGCAYFHEMGGGGGEGSGGGVKGTHARKDCGKNGTKCEVIVTVAACKPDGSGLSVDFDELAVLSGTPPGKITWTIRPHTYNFSTNGIAFKPGVNYQNEFDTPEGNANVYKWQDKNPNLGSPRRFDYAVTVEDSHGNSCGKLDPTVINDA